MEVRMGSKILKTLGRFILWVIGALLSSLLGALGFAPERTWEFLLGPEWKQIVPQVLTLDAMRTGLVILGVILGVGIIGYVAIAILWKRKRRLALQLLPDDNGESPNSYLVSWSPQEHFDMTLHDRNWKKGAQLTLHLTNIGPGVVRHLTCEWRIKKNVQELVSSSMVFGDRVRIITRESLEVFGPDKMMKRPLANPSAHEIARIAEGETIELRAPEPFS
jgi:hypothetical protein